MSKHRDSLPPEKQLDLDWRFVRRVLSDSERQYQAWLKQQYAALTKASSP